MHLKYNSFKIRKSFKCCIYGLIVLQNKYKLYKNKYLRLDYLHLVEFLPLLHTILNSKLKYQKINSLLTNNILIMTLGLFHNSVLKGLVCKPNHLV